jgi:hypothetical protein
MHRFAFLALLAAIVFLSLPASVRADFVMVSGQLHAAARAQFQTSQNLHTPPDLILGSSYGNFSHSAGTFNTNASGGMVVTSNRQPTILQLSLDGHASAQGTAGHGGSEGSYQETFNLTEQSLVMVNFETTPGTPPGGFEFRNGAGDLITSDNGTFPSVFDLPAGQYTVASRNGILSIDGVGGGPIQQIDLQHRVTISLVPEPGVLGVLSASGVAVAARRKRRVQ